MEAFVYCWTDIQTNKLYVGWHKGSIDDGYVCSSKPMLEEYKKRPSDFKRQIIASGIAKDMVALEIAILKSEKVTHNDHYYNMHMSDGFYRISNHTEETKEKISRTKKQAGFRHSTETKKIISEKNKGRFSGNKNPNYGGMSGMLGKAHSEDTKLKMKAAIAKRNDLAFVVKDTCIYCGKTMNKANLAKYHNSKCKFKGME